MSIIYTLRNKNMDNNISTSNAMYAHNITPKENSREMFAERGSNGHRYRLGREWGKHHCEKSWPLGRLCSSY